MLRSNDDPELEKKYIELLWEKRVDGIVVVSTGRNEGLLLDICNRGTPVVFVDRKSVSHQADSVRADKWKGAYLAVEHMIQLGHTRIALANGPKDLVTCLDRFNGFVRALYDYNIPIENECIQFGTFTKEFGYDFMNWFVTQDPQSRPTAVLCGGTSIAYGCLSEAARLGISIPGNLSLICFGKPSFEELLHPQITYIDQRNDEVSEATASLIYEKIKDSSTPNRQIVYEPQLVIRDSVKGLTILDQEK